MKEITIKCHSMSYQLDGYQNVTENSIPLSGGLVDNDCLGLRITVSLVGISSNKNC